MSSRSCTSRMWFSARAVSTRRSPGGLDRGGDPLLRQAGVVDRRAGSSPRSSSRPDPPRPPCGPSRPPARERRRTRSRGRRSPAGRWPPPARRRARWPRRGSRCRRCARGWRRGRRWWWRGPGSRRRRGPWRCRGPSIRQQEGRGPAVQVEEGGGDSGIGGHGPTVRPPRDKDRLDSDGTRSAKLGPCCESRTPGGCGC